MPSELETLEGWGEKILYDLAEYHNGAAFKPKDWVEDGLPIVRIEQINNPNSETDKFNGFVLPRNLIDTGDLIFSWSATLKVVIWSGGPAVLNQHLYKVVPNNGVNKHLLRQILDFNMERLAGQSQGSTMKHVTRKELTKFKVRFPLDESEQEKIATILQSIDESIEQTEALIEKYSLVKAGMMHDLFTRGLTPDGKLRPPREDAPHLYKETPIGWFPKEWDVSELKTCVRSVQYGISTSLTDAPNGIPVLRMNNIQENAFDVSDMKFADTLEAKALKLKVGDILYNRTNSMQHVGKTAIWRNELPECSFASYLVRVYLDEPKLDREYFTFWMSQVSSQNSLRRYATPAVQQVNINPTNLQKIWISRPNDLDEQKSIVQKIDGVVQMVNTERTKLAKLKVQKSGLMHDLLTGKVAVKIDEPEAADV